MFTEINALSEKRLQTVPVPRLVPQGSLSYITCTKKYDAVQFC